jgi:hypothetical protein
MPEQAAPLPTVRSWSQFSLRDLLLFVTLTAIYLSAAVQLGRLEAAANPFQPDGFLFRFFRPSTLAIGFGSMFALMFWNEDRKSTRKLGAKQVGWRRPNAWRWSFVLASVGMVAVFGVAPLFPRFISPFAAGLGNLLALTVYVALPVRVGENGMAYQMGIFFPWSRFDVELSEADSTLTLKSNQKWWKWTHRLAIPAEHLERVKEILFESGKPTSRNTFNPRRVAEG